MTKQLGTGMPTFSFEFFPPKDAEGEARLWSAIDSLQSIAPDFISVTYGAGGSTRDRTIRITSEITKSIGVIDFWFMAGGKRIHKTVHHFIFKEVSGELTPQVTEVDEVSWFPLSEIVERLAYPDEKKLIAKSGEITL